MRDKLPIDYAHKVFHIQYRGLSGYGMCVGTYNYPVTEIEVETLTGHYITVKLSETKEVEDWHMCSVFEFYWRRKNQYKPSATERLEELMKGLE